MDDVGDDGGGGSSICIYIHVHGGEWIAGDGPGGAIRGGS